MALPAIIGDPCDGAIALSDIMPLDGSHVGIIPRGLEWLHPVNINDAPCDWISLDGSPVVILPRGPGIVLPPDLHAAIMADLEHQGRRKL